MGVIRAVEKTVCQVLVSWKRLKLTCKIMHNIIFFIPTKMRFVKNSEPFGAPKFMQE